MSKEIAHALNRAIESYALVKEALSKLASLRRNIDDVVEKIENAIIDSLQHRESLTERIRKESDELESRLKRIRKLCNELEQMLVDLISRDLLRRDEAIGAVEATRLLGYRVVSDLNGCIASCRSVKGLAEEKYLEKELVGELRSHVARMRDVYRYLEKLLYKALLDRFDEKLHEVARTLYHIELGIV